MIYGLVGRPRSGKSYEAVRYHIIEAVKQGRKVITNIPLNIDKFRTIFGDNADLIEVREFSFAEFGAKKRPFSDPADYNSDWRNESNQGPLFVIDEAHLVLPRQTNTEILEFYSMHGHYGIDILLLTQNLRKVNKDVRDMIETTYYCVKNTHLGTDKTYTKKVYLGSELKNPISQEERKYDKNYFGFYISHTASESPVVEAQAKDVKSVKDHWAYKWGRIFIVGGIVYLCFVFYFMFYDKDEPEQLQQAQSQIEEQQAQEDEPSSVFGVLDGFEFFISGYSKNLVFTNGRPNLNLSSSRVYVDVYAEKSYQFTLQHNDLMQLGYGFEQLSECVYKVSYLDSSRIVTCKPRQEPKQNPDKSLEIIGSAPSVSI